MSVPESLDPASGAAPGRLTAIYIAALAVMIAVTAMGDDDATQSVMRASIEAADTYAFYQAKNIRQTDYRLAADDFETRLADGALSPDIRQRLEEKLRAYRSTAERYESEPATGEGKKELLVKARGLEAERDLALKRGSYFDYGQALLQIAIVLASASLILGGSLLLWFSVGLGAFGGLIALNGYTLWVALPFLS